VEINLKLLYGTTNPSKLAHMKDMLNGLDIEIVGLSELGVNINIHEGGKSPLENAMIKAKAYYLETGISCFSADSGLYISGLEESSQPGVFVRRVGDSYLDDEAFITHYQKIALNLGGNVRAQFKNAICLILEENHIHVYDGEDIADHFILTGNIHSKRKVGFPMDSIAIDIETGNYFVDEGFIKNEERIREGIRNFFIRTLNLNDK